MKNNVFCLMKKPGKIFALLFLPMAIIGFADKVNAQGWSFTATLTYSGSCGGSVPTIPPITIPYLPTKSDCESLRQTVLSYIASSGGCSVFYTCTPCTGADISNSFGQTEPGSVSIDGPAQGTAFFSPHESRGLENWIDDYVVKMESMGISVEGYNSLTMQDIPLTGNAEFDKGYVERMVSFEYPEQGGVVDLTGKTGVVDLNSTAANTGSTVQSLTNSKEQQERDAWYAENFGTLTQSGADNTIDASGTQSSERSWGDALLRTSVTSAPGLIGVAGDFMINTVDETLGGIQRVGNNLAAGNDAQALDIASNLPSNVVINSGKKAIINVIAGKATDIAGGPLLKMVKGAETVYSVANFLASAWENK
jgi:hypothetical protein